MFRSAFLLIVILIFSALSLSAQDCAVNLRNAENKFNSGLVEEVPELLESCLESGFTAAEELSAYKLIIRSYMFDDKNDLAEQMMLKFLKKNPEYEISPTDNADFIYLFNKFRVKPVIQLGLHGGLNFTYIMGMIDQSVSGDPKGSSNSNESMTIMAGGLIKYKINNKFEMGLELNYSEASFKNTEDFLNYKLIEYSEKQRRFVTALNAYYSPWDYNGFIPYFKVGAGLAFNISIEGTPLSANIDINNPGEDAGSSENRLEYRTQLDPLISVGFGCKYKLPSGFAFVDVGTFLGTLNQTNSGHPGSLEQFYYITDDHFRLNTLRFSVGYIFILYKPERIQE